MVVNGKVKKIMTPTEVEIAHLKIQMLEMRLSLLNEIDGILARLERINPQPPRKSKRPLPSNPDEWERYLEEEPLQGGTR